MLDAPALLTLQATVHDVPLADNIKQAILRLTHSSRPQDALADDYVKKYVSWGAGPRAGQTLVRAAKALEEPGLLAAQGAIAIIEIGRRNQDSGQSDDQTN